MSEENKKQIKYVKFNQMSSCFSVTADDGFVLYDTNPCIRRLYRAVRNGCDIASMHYKTEWTFLVSGSCLYIWDNRKEIIVSEMKFSKDILAVEHTRTCIILAFQHEVHIYNLSSKELLASYESSANPVISSSYSNDKTFVAFPAASYKQGYVTLVEIHHRQVLEQQQQQTASQQTAPQQIQQTTSQQQTSSVFVKKLQVSKEHWDIKAHEHDVTCISISNNGENMATASERGTMIRLWRTSTRDCVVEFRRGSAPTRITNIS